MRQAPCKNGLRMFGDKYVCMQFKIKLNLQKYTEYERQRATVSCKVHRSESNGLTDAINQHTRKYKVENVEHGTTTKKYIVSKIWVFLWTARILQFVLYGVILCQYKFPIWLHISSCATVHTGQ